MPAITTALYLAKSKAFLQLLARGFGRHQGPQNAAALTFATLLSLVPLMAVSLAIFYAFPVADRVQESIQDFLFQNFVPTSGEVLQEYMQAFSDKASRLSGVGFAFLLFVALMMMGNIDRALNTIWEVRSKRPLLSKFLIYWAILTLSPLLVGVSVVVTSYLISLPLLSDTAASSVGRKLFGLAPVLVSALAFSLMYAVIPNVRVRFKHAIAGGLVAAVLFELAKRGFGLYVTTFPTYEAIYGAMATIPIFLVWVYLSWMVVLLGAEFTHCLRIFRWPGQSGSQVLGFNDAVQLLLRLDQAAGEGEALSADELTATQARWHEDQIDTLLNTMLQYHWVHQTRDGRWALARRLVDLSLHEVYQRGNYPLPQENAPSWPQDAVLAERLRLANQQVAGALDVPLADFRQTKG